MKTYAAVLASVITIVAILGGVFITKVSALSSPERYFQKGKRSYEIENYQEAINNLNEYLSIDSKSRPINNIAEAYFMVADSLKRLKKYSLAKERLANIINNPDFVQYSTNAVLAYADISRLENHADPYIISKLQENLKVTDPNLASKINVQYGYQLFLQKKYGEALSYFLRNDFEGIEQSVADKLMSELEQRLPQLSGKQFGSFTVSTAYPFVYNDPVDNTSTQNGLIVHFTDGSRIVYRLSGTGTNGATLRTYIERYVTGDIDEDPNKMLQELCAVSREISNVTALTGKEQPDIIT